MSFYHLIKKLTAVDKCQIIPEYYTFSYPLCKSKANQEVKTHSTLWALKHLGNLAWAETSFLSTKAQDTSMNYIPQNSLAWLKNSHLYLSIFFFLMSVLDVFWFCFFFFRIEDYSHCRVSHILQISGWKSQIFKTILDIFLWHRKL